MENMNIKILVVDDESRMRKLVKDFLAREGYTVLEAGDGMEAMDVFDEEIDIALVILDVMMPKMDGWQVCREIRESSKVPIIMLTARSEERDELQGFELGVDEYISKPFSAKLLKVRLQNLLDNRKRLKDFFGDKASIRTSSVSDTDKGFAEKLKSLIEDNLSNPEFSVESLGESIGMSRVQLYRKTKVLTGYSPVELLRVARLKRAASILSSSDRTVSEAAYMSGFNSPSYFAKCYREYFGENPTDLLKRKK